MKLHVIRQGSALCVLFVISTVVCAQDAPQRPKRNPFRIYPPAVDAKAAGAKAIKMFDTNKDGKLTPEEYGVLLKEQFVEMDSNGDAVLVTDEFGVVDAPAAADAKADVKAAADDIKAAASDIKADVKAEEKKADEPKAEDKPAPKAE